MNDRHLIEAAEAEIKSLAADNDWHVETIRRLSDERDAALAEHEADRAAFARQYVYAFTRRKEVEARADKAEGLLETTEREWQGEKARADRMQAEKLVRLHARIGELETKDAIWAAAFLKLEAERDQLREENRRLAAENAALYRQNGFNTSGSTARTRLMLAACAVGDGALSWVEDVGQCVFCEWSEDDGHDEECSVGHLRTAREALRAEEA
jgi:hypothetical protein